jgi:hypothetical protein
MEFSPERIVREEVEIFCNAVWVVWVASWQVGGLAGWRVGRLASWQVGEVAKLAGSMKALIDPGLQ